VALPRSSGGIEIGSPDGCSTVLQKLTSRKPELIFSAFGREPVPTTKAEGVHVGHH